VLTDLLNCGLQVSALELLDIDLVASEEFLEVYKNVVPEYVDMARELSSGPFLAVELTGESAVERFREICGPRDVDVAKRIRYVPPTTPSPRRCLLCFRGFASSALPSVFVAWRLACCMEPSREVECVHLTSLFACIRVLRPDTLRAKYGIDTVHNGIHCTDLVDDGPLESDFLFVAMSEGV
jgi:nucleoside-diphosphate kinase